MHSISHSIAHRAPPAARTRVRWQPYNSLQASPSPALLITPAPFVSPTPPITCSRPFPETDRPKIPFFPQAPKDCQIRESNKTRYAVGLVDQAVKTLNEIWQPLDIPLAFKTTSRALALASGHDQPKSISSNLQWKLKNTQLPSPVSPSTHPSPPSPPTTLLALTHHPGQPKQDDRGNLPPIKGFVHEVLRRSRTSGSVLQTALCYLEAIRSKVPELVRIENSGESEHLESDMEPRIIQGDVSLEPSNSHHAEPSGSIDETMDTVRVRDGDEPCSGSFASCDRIAGHPAALPEPQSSTKVPSASLPPLPLMPSPLLCPRRAFLASLILASKFTQDRCYSNKAWAKLSGLPPREIGRCERALGEALEWRLWVGKLPTKPPLGRAVVRSRSEGDVLGSPPTQAQAKFFYSTFTRPIETPGSRLLRSATLPAEMFSNPFSTSTATLQSAPPPEFDTPMSATPSYAAGRIHMESPTLSTPSLTYSPSPTSSSDGDRTVQMSSFIDLPTPSNGCFPPLSVGPEEKDFQPEGFYPTSAPFTVNSSFGGSACNLKVSVPPTMYSY